jgi:Uncharacterised nucleotidyltransferase
MAGESMQSETPAARKVSETIGRTLATASPPGLDTSAPGMNRPEERVLLCCARTRLDAGARSQLEGLLRHDLDWEYLAGVAASHGVIPLLYRTLDTGFPHAVPKVWLEQLRDAYHASGQRSASMAAELIRILDLFEAHQISAVPFKGPVLAASIYRDLSLRQFGDLDLLVHRKSILRAGELLVEHGYQKTGAGLGPHEDPEHVAYLWPRFYVFVHRDHRTRVDLQWRIAERYFAFSLDSEPLWNRLVPVSLGGRAVLTFAPADLLLILCVHGSKHRWEALKWICDVAELVERYRSELDWWAIQQEAARFRVERMLGLGLWLAHHLLGAALPPEVSQRLEADSRLRRLAREVEESLLARGRERSRGLERIVLYLRAKDRWQDRARFCWRYVSQFLQCVVVPTSKDRAVLRLPGALSFLYYFIRPFRLTAHYGRSGLARISKGLS